jgi:hypothetical protein
MPVSIISPKFFVPVREVEVALDVSLPVRIRNQIVRQHAELGPQELEAEAMRQAQVARQVGRAFFHCHVARHREAHVHPRAHVGGFEAVLFEQPEPVVDPRDRRPRIALDLGFSEDLDARGTGIGNMVEQVLQRHHGPEVLDVAVGGNTVLE